MQVAGEDPRVNGPSRLSSGRPLYRLSNGVNKAYNLKGLVVASRVDKLHSIGDAYYGLLIDVIVCGTNIIFCRYQLGLLALLDLIVSYYKSQGALDRQVC